MNDPVAVLLAELGTAKKSLASVKHRLRETQKSRDVWREKACVTTPARRAAMKAWRQRHG